MHICTYQAFTPLKKSWLKTNQRLLFGSKDIRLFPRDVTSEVCDIGKFYHAISVFHLKFKFPPTLSWAVSAHLPTDKGRVSIQFVLVPINIYGIFMVNLANHFARPPTYHLLDIQSRESFLSPYEFRRGTKRAHQRLWKIIDSDVRRGSFQKHDNTLKFEASGQYSQTP